MTSRHDIDLDLVIVHATLFACLGLVGCASGDPSLGRAERRSSAVVYGTYNRLEYFEVPSNEDRDLMSNALVALVPRTSLRLQNGNVSVDGPTWAEAAGLCPGEPFADQTVAAFCSGVLVDWDLVLTSGHCMRLLALQDFVVVFGYYYDRPDHLDVHETDLANPLEILHEDLGSDGDSPRLDYAWLKLDRLADPKHHPAPVYVRRPPIAVGDPIFSIGTGGGIPLKWDAGGTVQDARLEPGDYFAADTDTSKGSSGGGAFDGARGLTGIMARGGFDLMPTDAGCNVTVHLPNGPDAGEQFTYAHRAVESLCEQHPTRSICRTDCGDPCQAPPRPTLLDDGGCSIGPRDFRGQLCSAPVLLLLLAGVLIARRAAAESH